MANVNLKLIILGLLVIVGLIFAVQNLSPVVPLVIFGSETIALPVSFWVILSAIAGFLTSIILQFLFGIYAPKKRRPREWEEDEEEFEFPEAEADRNERFTAQTSSNSQEKTQSQTSDAPLPEEAEEDWESPPQREDWNRIDDDWDIEQPPKRDPFAQRKADNFYEQPEPSEEETPSRQESATAYRYRGDPYANNRRSNPEESRIRRDDSYDIYNQEEEEEETPPSPTIYEANYRVIRPPLWNLPQEDNDDDER